VLWVILGARPVARSADPEPELFRPRVLEVTVAPGDNLWNIAKKLAPSRDTRYVIYRIRKENRLSSANIFPGQVLRFPIDLAGE
jgi:nucleoid-associated protein YgaU